MEVKLSGSWPLQGLSLSPSISRFVTWENDDFRNAATIPSTWLISLNVAGTLF
jgi:hypothetical protein